MIDEAQKQQDATIDHLLELMHRFGSSYRVGQGYPSRAAGTDQYRASRQHDGDNGAADSDADHETGAAVSRIVDAMTDPHRTCLRIEARNICQGVKVWTSARLPLCPIERSIIRMEARNALWRSILSAGLV